MRVLIAIPALNESQVIAASVRRLLAFVSERMAGDAVTIVVADNGSTDGTAEIVTELAAADARVRLLRLPERGKGLAIRAAWQSDEADVYVFMDADLATDLVALPELVRAAAESGGVAVGSRFLPQSDVERSIWRRALSYGYRQFARWALATRISDLPCGFKAIAREALGRLLPETRDNGWFFDTELAVRAERAAFAVREVPVRWREHVETGRKSRVSVPRLMAEYVRRVWRLRRDLRDAAERRERLWFWGLTLMAVVITSIPPVVAWIAALNHGTRWLGSSFLSPGDFTYYLAMLEQARAGRWLFENLFTTEVMPAQLNVFWLVLGKSAGLMSLSSVAAWQLARLLLIPVMAVASYGVFRQVLARSRERIVALTLLLFGGGFGPLFLVLGGQIAEGEAWPIDLWVSEANGFMTAAYSPHFLAAWALLAFCFGRLLRLLTDVKRRDGLVGLVLGGAALSFTYPFLAVVTSVVPLVWWLVASWRKRQVDRTALLPTVALSMSGLPALGYYFLWSRLDETTAAFSSANVCLTPSFWYVALGLGLPLLLAIPGYRLLRRGSASLSVDLILAWAVVQLILAYVPFVFQRRLLAGALLPLLVLAAPVLVWAYERFRSQPKVLRGVAVLLLAITVILPSAGFAVSRGVLGYRDGRSETYFMDESLHEPLSWAKRNGSSQDAYIGDLHAMYLLPGLSGRRVFAGHWVATLDAAEKVGATQAFFATRDDGVRANFMRQHGLTHVWCGAATLAAGDCPEAGKSFILEYDNGEVRILRLAP